MKLVLDVSNWDADTFDAVCLKSAGIQGVIIGCQILSQSIMMADKAKVAALAALGTYAFLWDVETPAIRTQKAITGAQYIGCKYVWLDCEDGATMPGTVTQRIADVSAAVEAVRTAGLIPGIYTSPSFWQEKMGNTSLFSALPLWLANWGLNNGQQQPITTVNFGGWTKVSVHQFAGGSVTYCGRVRDANYYMIEDALTAEQLPELVMQLIRVTVGAGTPDPIAALATENSKGTNLLLYANRLNDQILALQHELEPLPDYLDEVAGLNTALRAIQDALAKVRAALDNLT